MLLLLSLCLTVLFVCVCVLMCHHRTTLCLHHLHLTLHTKVGCEEEKSWAHAVKVLVDNNIPSCFTSMNAGELQLDVAALKAGGANIIHQGKNTFGSLVPLRDMDAGADEFYYTNGFVICCKGPAQPAEAAAGAAPSQS